MKVKEKNVDGGKGNGDKEDKGKRGLQELRDEGRMRAIKVTDGL